MWGSGLLACHQNASVDSGPIAYRFWLRMSCRLQASEHPSVRRGFHAPREVHTVARLRLTSLSVRYTDAGNTSFKQMPAQQRPSRPL